MYHNCQYIRYIINKMDEKDNSIKLYSSIFYRYKF